MRVLIADDHPLVRKGIIELVRSEHHDWKCREAGTLEDAVACCEREAIDLVTTDLMMPGVSGPASLAVFRRFPHLKVVVLTGSDDRAGIMECLGAGIRGYLLKSAGADHLLHAIEIVIEGGIYLPATFTGAWRASPATRADCPTTLTGPALTGRQREVLELLSEGCSTKEIARRMHLGIGTVKIHLAGVYKGLGARNRMEAIVKAGRPVAA